MEKDWIFTFTVLLMQRSYCVTHLKAIKVKTAITPGIVSFIPTFDHRAHINSHLA